MPGSIYYKKGQINLSICCTGQQKNTEVSKKNITPGCLPVLACKRGTACQYMNATESLLSSSPMILYYSI
jgi:hypothetical protein